MKKEKEMMPEMDVSMALHHLEKAEEIKKNKKLMAQIKAHHEKLGQVIGGKKPVKSLDELKVRAKKVTNKKDESEAEDMEGDE